ncbi:hypothetical protein LXA43DRAFT_879616 [Ganoderma leucocontextum]|nr:hypothetical protein LXA43DRAFT_879616 [Ganoderma leucocontextum]
MTPRGVQVWFQNRRAKTKQQAKKADAAATPNSSKPPAVDGLAGTSPSNPPIAPRPEADGDDDHKELDEDALSPAPPSPQPCSEETALEDGDRLPHVPSDAANSNVNENEHLNSTPDSRRGSIAPSHPLPSWAMGSPSASSPVSAPQPVTVPTSVNASPSSAGHVNAHVRLSTHPPSATAYSNNHLAPPDIYAQRRTSLPVASLSPHAASRLGLVQKRGFDPSRRRLSSDVSGHGGHRMLAHPYMHVAATANGSNAYSEGHEGAHHPQMRRPQLMARMSAPFPPGAHQNHLHPGHSHTMPIVPSQGRSPLPTQRSYDVSGMPASPQAPMYNHGPPQGYDLFAPRHSIDGSALGLMHAHAQMNIGMPQQMNGGMGEAYNMDMDVGPLDQRTYVISQRPIAPPVPGPLPSPNFSFGNPFGPSSSSNSSSNSASGTPPHGASPPLLSLPRRPSEGGVSDADTEESSAGPLSRFGSVASLGGSEVSWTSAYTSEGGMVEGAAEEGNICASRRESCASGHFLELFSDLEVGSNGGTPAPPSLHEQHQHQLRHASSSSHLSPSNYPTHHIQAHSPGAQVSQIPTDGDDGYPSPSSASTISAGSTHSHQHGAHDTANQHAHVVNGNGSRVSQGHSRTNTSSELAFALQDAPAKGDIGHLQYPDYGPSGGDSIANEHGYPQYAQEQTHQPHPDYVKGQAHFPTVYEGYVYPSPGDGQIAGGNEAYAAGAIELSHMCVPASEGAHFIGGYMQYS